MHVTGACHCGQIRYEAEIDLAAVSICHCTDCQKITGSSFRVNVPAKKENFKMLAGVPKLTQKRQRVVRSAYKPFATTVAHRFMRQQSSIKKYLA